MRILLAIHGYPPASSAGAERQTQRMAQWLKQHGHEAEVFAIEALHARRTEVVSRPHEGVLVHRLHFELADVASRVVGHYDHPRIGEAFRTVLADRPRFDLVHVVSGYWLGNQVIRAAHAQGLPVVVSLMEFWFMCSQLNLIQPTGTLCSGPENDDKCARCVLELSRRYRFLADASPRFMDVAWALVRSLPGNQRLLSELATRRRVLREALLLADQVICNSRFLIDKFTEAGFDTRNFRYLRQGLPRESRREESRPERGPGLRLGYLGQVKFHKGVDLLVDAVVALVRAGANVSLDIWGPLHEEPEFVRALEAKTKGLEGIRWRGVYGESGARGVLRELDAVVVPSRWNENSPNVILEAYDMGLPVIATRLGGMAELVAHETSGLVFAREDTHDLRTQIQRLLTEPGLYDRLRSGIPPVRSVDDEMDDVTALYARVLGDAAPRLSPAIAHQ